MCRTAISVLCDAQGRRGGKRGDEGEGGIKKREKEERVKWEWGGGVWGSVHALDFLYELRDLLDNGLFDPIRV
jgi:hypothetical protein